MIKRESKARNNYIVVDNVKRSDLIYLVKEKQLSITEAARLVGIKYENAKLIYSVFVIEGRVKKIEKWQRKITTKSRDCKKASLGKHKSDVLSYVKLNENVEVLEP